MSARPCHDWSVLKWNSDPVPGDPDHVEQAATNYRSTATAIDGAASNLRRLTSDSCSVAVDAILKQSHEAAEALAKVSSRYSGTAYALAGYAPELREAQRMAEAAGVVCSGS